MAMAVALQEESLNCPEIIQLAAGGSRVHIPLSSTQAESAGKRQI